MGVAITVVFEGLTTGIATARDAASDALVIYILRRV